MAPREILVSIPNIPKPPKLPKVPKLPERRGLPGANKLPGAAKPSGAAPTPAVKPGGLTAAAGKARAAAGGVQDAMAGPGKPVAQTSLKDDLKNAAKGGGAPPPGEKESLRSAALGVAAKMAKGAAKGASTAAVDGGASALAGAVKEGALAIVKNKRLRGILIAVLAVIVVISIAIPIAQATIVLSALSSVAANNDAHAQSSSKASGVKETEYAKDLVSGQQYGIPWTIFTSVRQQTSKAPDAAAITEALDKVDPSHKYRSLDAGTVYEEGTGIRIVLASNPSHKAAAQTVADTYIAALKTLPGFDETAAESTYKRALTWWLGQELKCTATASSVGAPGGLSVKGTPMTVEQKVIAKIVIGVTKTLIVGKPEDTVRAAKIAMSVAIVENAVRNGLVMVDHDSLGVFQQRANWGSADDRIRPDWATARFLTGNSPDGLVQQVGWNTRPAGVVAQDVQVSAFDTKYTEAMPEAKDIVETLWNESPALPVPAGFREGSTSPGKVGDASPAPTVCVSANGAWVAPFLGKPTVNSWFSWLGDTCDGCRNHDGVDFGVKSGDPVLSVSAGTVLVAAKTMVPGYGCGYWVQIQHAGAVMRYCHLLNATDLNVGDKVTAGQQIGVAGSTGDSTGTHLHFDVTVNGARVDPVPFMLARGVDFTHLPLWSVSPYQG
jgi:murein DD-endopeptidase MepM/ murein hydrolase activator NlpD